MEPLVKTFPVGPKVRKAHLLDWAETLIFALTSADLVISTKNLGIPIQDC